MRRLELVFLFLGLPRSKLILWTFYGRDFVFFYILVLVAGYSIGFFEGRAILDSETLIFGIRLAVIVISLDIERDKKENMATSLFFFFFFQDAWLHCVVMRIYIFTFSFYITLW